MTQRELFTAVIEGNITDEVVEAAKDAIAKLDHTNELRKVKNAEKKVAKDAEKAPIRDALMAVMSNEPQTATSLIAAAGLDIKPQSIPSLMKPFVEDGTVVKTEVKADGKKLRGYVLA